MPLKYLKHLKPRIYSKSSEVHPKLIKTYRILEE